LAQGETSYETKKTAKSTSFNIVKSLYCTINRVASNLCNTS